jgi:hypothetical protein
MTPSEIVDTLLVFLLWVAVTGLFFYASAP